MPLRGVTTPAGVFAGAPAWPVITLDTHAPEVTWGTPVGTTAGELLQVAYTLDEPELLDATLTLIDGRVLVLSVYADRLELVLPADASDGPATVRARVRDDVANEAIRELVVVITGVPYVPPQTPPTPARPGWPVPRRPREQREHVVQVRSRVRARSSARVGATRRSRERLVVVGHARLAGPRRATPLVDYERGGLRARSSTRKATSSTSSRRSRRMEASDDEVAAFAFGDDLPSAPPTRTSRGSAATTSRPTSPTATARCGRPASSRSRA
jgi:hypothetical protein